MPIGRSGDAADYAAGWKHNALHDTITARALVSSMNRIVSGAGNQGYFAWGNDTGIRGEPPETVPPP